MNAKSKYVALLAMLSPSIAMAQFFEGPFVGFNAGISQSQEQITHTVNANLPLNNATNTIINAAIGNGNPAKITDFSFIGGLNLGYTHPLTPCVLVSIDARAYLLDFKMSHRLTALAPLLTAVADLETKVKMSQQYTALAKIGWLLYPQTQIYGLAGPQFGVFRIHAKGKASVVPPSGGPTITAFHDESKKTTKWGYLIGLGIEHLITEHSSIGLEYNLANYLSLSFPKITHSSFTYTGTGIPPGADIQTHNSIKMLTNSTFLKYNYYFEC